MFDVARTAGILRGRFYAGKDTVNTVRVYRVPEGTPCLPFPHSFLHPYWLGKEHPSEPGDSAVPVGFFTRGIKYDKGALPPNFKAGAAPIGTPQQWQQGSAQGEGLVWEGGFSTACRGLPAPQGQACATGCPECPLVSPVWVVDTEDFGPLTAGVVVKRTGCEWNSQTVAASPACPTGTAAAWSVTLEAPFAGFTDGVVVTRGLNQWSSCCIGA